MKRILPFLMIGFGVALAVVVGQKMSQDAMAVVIGVAVGVAASVPTSLLLVALLRRERSSYRQPEQPPMQPIAQPNVIVLDPSQFGQGKQQAQLPIPPEYLPQAGVPEIKVIGREW